MVNAKKLLEDLRAFYVEQHEKNEGVAVPSCGYSTDGKPQFGFLEVPGSLRQNDYSTANLILVAASRNDEYKDSVCPDKAVHAMVSRIDDAICELSAVRAIYERALRDSVVPCNCPSEAEVSSAERNR